MRGTRASPGCFIEVDGARLRLADEGQGFPVLLVHGWALDLDMWQPQAEAWCSRLRVIRYDRRGFGLSSGSPSLAADARDLESLLRRLNLQRVAIVAMSQGARAALRAAAGPLRGRIACLVLDGSPFAGSDGGEPEVPLARYGELARTRGLAVMRDEWLRHPLARLRTDESAAHELLARMTARYPAHDLLAGPQPEPAAPPPPAAIDVPALVLNGADDTPRRRAMGDALAGALPNAERVIIEGAGHLPNLDQPDEYNRLVLSFIERHAAAHGPTGRADA
jgi:3-oxoadipate enol-lactonase